MQGGGGHRTYVWNAVQVNGLRADDRYTYLMLPRRDSVV